MISLPPNSHIWIAAGVTDLRRGFTGLSALVQNQESLPLASGRLHLDGQICQVFEKGDGFGFGDASFANREHRHIRDFIKPEGRHHGAVHKTR
jgi:hypothetical protein